MQSQKQKILNMLLDNIWVCSSNFYVAYIADPRRRICDLKKDGYILENRKCQSHDFHRGYSKEWKLLSKPKEEIKGIDWSKENLADALGRPDLKEILQISLF